MEVKCEKTSILEPVNPNKATALFTGKSSGILNWNDLLYPKMNDLRKLVRDTFYSTSKLELGVKEQNNEEVEKVIEQLLVLTQVSLDLISEVESYTTDPSVVSIIATMTDQCSEHLHSLYRIKSNEFDTISYAESTKITQPEDIVKVLQETINVKSDIKELVQRLVDIEAISNGNKLVEQLQLDMSNHIEFLEFVLQIAKEEIL